MWIQIINMTGLEPSSSGWRRFEFVMMNSERCETALAVIPTCKQHTEMSDNMPSLLITLCVEANDVRTISTPEYARIPG